MNYISTDLHFLIPGIQVVHMQIQRFHFLRLSCLFLIVNGLLTSCGLVDEPTSSVTCVSNCSTSTSTSTGSPTPTNTGPRGTGLFLDSAVQGVNFQTTSGLSGTTDASGKFDYRTGDEVNFTIGATQLGQVVGSTILTPVEVVGASDSSDPRVINMSRFLQTLDDDGDPTNGIGISTATVTALGSQSFSFNQSLDAFSSAFSSVISLRIGRSLVSAQQAINHLNSTLKQQGRGGKIADPSKLASVIPSYKSGAFFCEAKGSASCNDANATKFDGKSVFVR